jgi:hypothetical protein
VAKQAGRQDLEGSHSTVPCLSWPSGQQKRGKVETLTRDLLSKLQFPYNQRFVGLLSFFFFFFFLVLVLALALAYFVLFGMYFYECVYCVCVCVRAHVCTICVH